MIKRLGIEKYIDRLYHRKDCKSTWHGLAKDLSILNIPLKDVVLIDVTYAFVYMGIKLFSIRTWRSTHTSNQTIF